MTNYILMTICFAGLDSEKNGALFSIEKFLDICSL